MHCVARKQHECSVSRRLPLGHGCRYTDASACNDDGNTELPRDQKTRSTQRTKRPRNLLGNYQKKQLPKCAKRTPPNDNEAPPEKRRNEGGDVFSGGCARRALRPAPPGEARTC